MDEEKERWLKQASNPQNNRKGCTIAECVRVYVCVRVCDLPAGKCVVLLFQGNFPLLDLNHFPGQIFRLPTEKRRTE